MSNNNQHQLEKLETKIDRLDERLDSVEKVLVLQEANLREHMRRNDNLEAMIMMFKADTDRDLAPVIEHVNKVKLALTWAVKICIGVAAFAGFVLTVVEIFRP